MDYLSIVLWMSFSSVQAYGPHHPRPGHTHHRVEPNVKLTEDHELLQDKEHIREDMKNVVAENVADSLTPEELEFYYFSVHDSDNNTKLDGLEILHAVQHTNHEEDQKSEKIDNIQQIIDLIDQVLEEDDFDKDGYLSYIEYVHGRKREEHNRKRNGARSVN